MNKEMFLPFASRLARTAAAIGITAAMIVPAAHAANAGQAGTNVVRPDTTVTITDHERDGCGKWFLAWTSNPAYSTYQIWRKPSTGTTYTLYQTVAEDFTDVVVGTSGAYNFKIKAGTTFSAPVLLSGSTIDCNNS